MPRRKLGRNVGKARRLRREFSLPETLLWNRLKGTDGHFRKQHPIADYILDFYCASARLAIAVDGFAHDTGTRPQRDETRTQWLNGQGIEVLRIAAKDVLADPDAVAEAILRLCFEPLHHSALPSGPPPCDAAACPPDRPNIASCGAGRSE